MVRISDEQIREFLKTNPETDPDFLKKLEAWKLTLPDLDVLPPDVPEPTSRELLVSMIGQDEADRIEADVGVEEMKRILLNAGS